MNIELDEMQTFEVMTAVEDRINALRHNLRATDIHTAHDLEGFQDAHDILMEALPALGGDHSNLEGPTS